VFYSALCKHSSQRRTSVLTSLYSAGYKYIDESYCDKYFIHPLFNIQVKQFFLCISLHFIDLWRAFMEDATCGSSCVAAKYCRKYHNNLWKILWVQNFTTIATLGSRPSISILVFYIFKFTWIFQILTGCTTVYVASPDKGSPDAQNSGVKQPLNSRIIIVINSNHYY